MHHSVCCHTTLFTDFSRAAFYNKRPFMTMKGALNELVFLLGSMNVVAAVVLLTRTSPTGGEQ